MKKLKVLVLVIGLLFLTGCTMVCDVYIERTSFDVKISLRGNKTIPDEYKMFSWSQIGEQMATNTIPFNQMRIEDGDVIGYDLSYKYSITELRPSDLFQLYYETSSLIEGDDLVYIDASGFHYNLDTAEIHMDDFVLRITTNHIVEDHNATSVNGNVYTWRLDSSNKFPDIKFVYNKTKFVDDGKQESPTSTSSQEEKETVIDDKNAIWIVLVGIVGFVVCLFIVIKLRSRK